jgi:hypothetical protein
MRRRVCVVPTSCVVVVFLKNSFLSLSLSSSLSVVVAGVAILLENTLEYFLRYFQFYHAFRVYRFLATATILEQRCTSSYFRRAFDLIVNNMNEHLEPDLDDTVETLIAKGFSRVKATKLFYENQKIKAQQKNDQPLYHVDVCDNVLCLQKYRLLFK